jgi:hypothetical protein
MAEARKLYRQSEVLLYNLACDGAEGDALAERTMASADSLRVGDQRIYSETFIEIREASGAPVRSWDSSKAFSDSLWAAFKGGNADTVETALEYFGMGDGRSLFIGEKSCVFDEPVSELAAQAGNILPSNVSSIMTGVSLTNNMLKDGMALTGLNAGEGYATIFWRDLSGADRANSRLINFGNANAALGYVGNSLTAISGVTAIADSTNQIFDISLAAQSRNDAYSHLLSLSALPQFRNLPQDVKNNYWQTVLGHEDTINKLNFDHYMSHYCSGNKILANVALLAAMRGPKYKAGQTEKILKAVKNYGLKITENIMKLLGGDNKGWEKTMLDTDKQETDRMNDEANQFLKRMFEATAEANRKAKEKELEREEELKKWYDDVTYWWVDRDFGTWQWHAPEWTGGIEWTGSDAIYTIASRFDDFYSYTTNEQQSDYNPNWTYDPEGFAWAGTADDESGANARFWSEADDYDQVNPQITGESGYYQWFTPTGWWQVRLSKDGYRGAQSAWLPVLPIQVGVNLEISSFSAFCTINPESQSFEVFSGSEFVV